VLSCRKRPALSRFAPSNQEVPHDAKEADLQLRVMAPKELALFVTLRRQGLGWTQETLAEISGLTVRTVQRVENGEPSSVDTRRALARAFKIENIDVFNKPHAFSSSEKIKKDAEEFKKNHLTLAVTVAATGKRLANLAEEMTMRCFQQPDGIARYRGVRVLYFYLYSFSFWRLA
jgi:transcriptional regulator with XRE-family HTH domain